MEALAGAIGAKKVYPLPGASYNRKVEGVKGLADGLFHLEEILGSGTFAHVVVATATDGGLRRVALKVLRRQFLTDAAVLARFHDEAQILMRFDHPNIVDAYRLLHYDDQPVLEMELVEGVALDRVLREYPDGIPSRFALHIVSEVAKALRYAWEAGVGEGGEPLRIIHRDVKPNNVLLSTSGAVKIADFGIAKGDFDDRKAKSLYMVHGSVGYDPPERKSGETPDTPAIDVYALGIMLFVLITGRSIILSHKQERHDLTAEKQLEHVVLDDVDDDQAVRDLIRHMIQFDASARPSMGAVIAAIDDICSVEGLWAEMNAFAKDNVEPFFAQRTFKEEPEDRESLSFLENTSPSPPSPKLSSDAMIVAVRAFMSQPDWEQDVPGLQRLITRCDTFVEVPFLDLLDRASVPKWKIWSQAARPSEVEAVLMILCDHPSDQVVKKARKLQVNREPRVAAAARFLVSQSGR